MICPTKIGVPYNFCFIKFSPNWTVEAAEAPQPHLGPPWPWGLGYGVKSQLLIFHPLRSIPMPNCIEIGWVVWISIPDIHTHTHTHTHTRTRTRTSTNTHWLLYIRYFNKKTYAGKLWWRRWLFQQLGGWCRTSDKKRSNWFDEKCPNRNFSNNILSG